MWKHVSAAAIALAISGCTSNAPAAADVARAEANVADLERAADASCPTTAWQVHLWARKAREAIALGNGSLLSIAQNGMTLAAASCKTEKDNPRLYAFDPAALEQFKRPGSASLLGQAFLRQGGGGVVTCAGASVTLMVETLYVLTLSPVLIYGESLPPDAARHLADSVVQKTTCDAQGHFAFKGLVPGNYLVLTTVSWMVLGERQGGPMQKSVRLSPGDNEVILSQ